MDKHKGVTKETMAAHLAENDLWGQIFWGAAQCPGPALYTFCEAKICHLVETQTEKELTHNETEMKRTDRRHANGLNNYWPLRKAYRH